LHSYFTTIDTHSMWKKTVNNLVTHAGSASLNFCTYKRAKKPEKIFGIDGEKL